MNTTVRHVGNQANPNAVDPAATAAQFAERLLSDDCERLVEEFYTEGARLVPPDCSPIMGRDPIRRHWTGIVEAGLKGAEIRISCVERAGREAVGLGRYTLAFGSDERHESGAFFVRYRRQGDGSWKAAEQIFHSDTAA